MSPGKAQAFKALFFVLRAAASVMLLAPEFTSPLNSPRPPKKGEWEGEQGGARRRIPYRLVRVSLAPRASRPTVWAL